LTETLGPLVYGALATTCMSIESNAGARSAYIHPFEILTIVRRLLLILPGDVALAVTLEICEDSPQLSGQDCRVAGQGWQVPPGRLLCRQVSWSLTRATPVRYLRDLAEELLKSAKRRARESPVEQAEGGIDFLTLKSQSMLWSDLHDLRRQVYEVGFPQQNIREYIGLTGRPYLLSEMRRLLDHARLLRNAGFPHSQMQGIRRTLRQACTSGGLGHPCVRVPASAAGTTLPAACGTHREGMGCGRYDEGMLPPCGR